MIMTLTDISGIMLYRGNKAVFLLKKLSQTLGMWHRDGLGTE